MSSNAINTRRSAKITGSPGLPAPTISRRVVWVLAAGVWVFLFVALASFDSADAPSHIVAVHNTPPANLCGSTGAVIAYWAYQVIGIGSWVLLMGLGLALGVTVTGRVINQPLVRLVGLLIMSAAFSS